MNGNSPTVSPSVARIPTRIQRPAETNTARIERRAPEPETAAETVGGASTGSVERHAQAVRDAVLERVSQLDHDRSSIQIRQEVHDDTGRYVIKVEDVESGELIIEFPASGYLETAAAMDALAGLLVDGEI